MDRSDKRMQAYLVPTVFGVFIHDSHGEIILQHQIYPDVERADAMIKAITESHLTEALHDLLIQSRKIGHEKIIVESSMIARAIENAEVIATAVDEDSREIKMFRSMLDDILVREGIVKDKLQVMAFRREAALVIARERISEASRSPDLFIKHAIDTIGEIDKNINIQSMRLREWFSLFRPSLNKLVEDHDLFIQIIKMFENSGPTKERLLRYGMTEERADAIIASLELDMGAPITSGDIRPLIRLADSVKDLIETRNSLEEYASLLMQTVAPNITALVGPIVGARLISMAGSLLELSRKTSSTIQVLGAEKALFRSLKTGTAPPKHGVIFQVPELYSAPYWQRGKIARALAGKIAIAARIDAFSKRNMGQMLKESFYKRVTAIKEQNPEPPHPKPQAPIKGRPKRQQSGRTKQGRYRKRRPRKR